MRVVLVEDDRDLRTVYSMLLQDEGWEVIEAADTSEARLLDWDGVDVAVIDWMLPGESGIEFAGWLRRTHPEVRRIIATAAPEAMTTLHGYPADLLVPKVQWPHGLIEILREVAGA